MSEEKTAAALSTLRKVQASLRDIDTYYSQEDLYDAIEALDAVAEQVAELLDALCQMVEFFQPNAWGSNENRVDALANARAAIAKATVAP